ncbi:delta-aminolevulinic acid dehydratase-like [Rhopilema esculentum]|uniref:delta-aminolevulinic acid dehydratase-like n=1 Tax=Rhopilema esculentum TaxID=499914 RepID=UPI0031CDE479
MEAEKSSTEWIKHLSLHSGYFHETLRDWQSVGSTIDASQLIYPLFISSNDSTKEEITSMPGQYRLGLDHLKDIVAPLVSKGLKTVLLFGIMETQMKDTSASNYASEKFNKVIPAVKLLRDSFPNLLIACDVCLCTFTSHGHCGIIKDNGTIDIKATTELLAKVALVYAEAGCHIVAPSDTMDGRVKMIAKILDTHGYRRQVAIMSYSAKFASCFYGPFRDAASSAPSFGDRKCYQLPPGGKGLALRSTERDIHEGADIVMVKPGMPYLDLVQQIKAKHPEFPLAIYQVSGEYAMLYHASKAGAFQLEAAVLEAVTSMRRAGADIIISYFTPLLLEILEKQRKK